MAIKNADFEPTPAGAHYQILTSLTPQELAKEVEKKIAAGMIPLGSPFAFRDTICQAVQSQMMANRH